VSKVGGVVSKVGGVVSKVGGVVSKVGGVVSKVGGVVSKVGGVGVGLVILFCWGYSGLGKSNCKFFKGLVC